MFTAFKLARTAKKLRSGDEKLQVQALGALSRMEDPRALEMMIGALRSPAAKLRHAASQHLSQLPGMHVTNVLIQLLIDQDAGTRSSAANALSLREITGALPTIREHLTTGQPQLQIAITDLLSTWTKAEAIGLLIEGLDHGNEEVRARAFDALVRSSTYRPNERVKAALLQLGPERLLDELGVMLEGSGHTYSAAELWINSWNADPIGELVRMDHPRALELMVRSLRWRSGKLREAAWRHLPRLRGANVTHALLQLLIDEDASTRSSSASALTQRGIIPGTWPAISEVLGNGEPRLQAAIIDLLEGWTQVEAVDLLIETLDHRNKEVGKKAFAALIRISVGGADKRANAALLQLGPERLLDGLRMMLVASDQTRSVADIWIDDCVADPIGDLARMDHPRALELMVAALRWRSEKLRQAAWRHLPTLRGEDVTRALVRLLIDDDSNVRISAVSALSQRDTPAAWRTIDEELENVDPRLQAAIIDLLGSWTKAEATDLLIKALGHQNKDVRTRAFAMLIRDPLDITNERTRTALLQMGPERLLDELGVLLKGKGDMYVTAVRWVISWDDPKSTDLLLGMLSHTRENMGTKVKDELAHRYDPRIKDALAGLVFLQGSEGSRVAAWDVMERGDPGMLWTIVGSVIQSGSQSAATMEWLIGHLGRIGGEMALTHLRSALDHRDREVRRAVVDQYGTMRDHRAIDPLIVALDDPDPQLGWHAARILCSINEEKARRYASNWALGRDKTVDPQVVKDKNLELNALRCLLMDQDPQVRMRALTRIARASEVTSIPILIEATKSAHPEIRRHAVLALLVAERAHDESSRTHKYDNWLGSFSQAARTALEDLSSELTAPALAFALSPPGKTVEDGRLRKAALKWLSHRWDGTLTPQLIAIMKSGDKTEIPFVIRAFGHSKDPRFVPILLTFLLGRRSGEEGTALDALMRMPLDAVLSALDLRTVFDYGVVLKLIEWVGSIKDPRSVDVLLPALDHSVQGVRFEVAKALSARKDPRTKTLEVSSRIGQLLEECELVERQRQIAARYERSSAPWSRGSSDKSVMN